MNITDLVELDELCSVVLNDREDYRIESCRVGSRMEVTMLEIKGDLELTKEENPYYINLAKIIESDINLFRSNGVKVSDEHKLLLNAIWITGASKENDVCQAFVYCTYKDYKEGSREEFRFLHGQTGEAVIKNNVIVVGPTFEINHNYDIE